MLLEFNDSGVVILCCILVFLSCTMKMMSTCLECFRPLFECFISSFEMCNFMPVNCGLLFRQLASIFVWLHPCILCLVQAIKHIHHVPSTFVELKNNAQLVDVDFIIVCLPFSILSSLNTIYWIFLGNRNILQEETIWGIDLKDAQDDDLSISYLMCYEILYYLECFALNLFYVFTISHGADMVSLLYACISISFVVAYFICTARATIENVSDQIPNTFMYFVSMFVFIPFTLRYIYWECDLFVYISIFYFLTLSFIIISHHITTGHATVSYILLVRQLSTFGNCLLILILTLVDYRSFCKNHLNYESSYRNTNITKVES
jgi:hypothetical protein